MNLVLTGMQAGVAAVIADVVIEMGGNLVKEKNVLSIFIMVAAFAASYLLNINVILIILICGVIGVIRAVYNIKKGAVK